MIYASLILTLHECGRQLITTKDQKGFRLTVKIKNNKDLNKTRFKEWFDKTRRCCLYLFIVKARQPVPDAPSAGQTPRTANKN